MILQMARVAVPWILMDGDGPSKWDPSPHQGVGVLTIPVTDVLEVHLLVSLETYRVMRSQGALAMGGETVAFETVYDDFQEVGGVLFPFSEETLVRGAHTASVKFHHVQPLFRYTP